MINVNVCKQQKIKIVKIQELEEGHAYILREDVNSDDPLIIICNKLYTKGIYGFSLCGNCILFEADHHDSEFVEVDLEVKLSIA